MRAPPGCPAVAAFMSNSAICDGRRCRQRRLRWRTDPPQPTTSTRATPVRHNLARDAAHEPLAVEHVARDPPIGRRTSALHEPAILTVVEASSSSATASPCAAW